MSPSSSSRLQVLYLHLLLIAVVASTNTPWHLQKHYHKSRTLTTRHLTTLASLSDKERMKRVELKPLLIERTPGSAGILKARQHIVSRLEALGLTVEVDRFTDYPPNGSPIEFVNVIGTVNPAARRKLVLACHYDSKNDTGFIGAIDSAVPCAMLLDLAHTLGPRLRKSKDSEEDLTLQLIFFDGEEAFETWTDTDSLYGARHLAELMENTSYPGPGSSTNMLDGIDMLVLLDLLGTPEPKFISFFDSTRNHFEKLLRTETRLANANLLDNYKKGNPYFRNTYSYSNGAVEDDHIPFLARDVDILHVIPMPFPSVWHTLHDNERSLDYTTIDNLSKIFRVFVAEYLHLPM